MTPESATRRLWPGRDRIPLHYDRQARSILEQEEKSLNDFIKISSSAAEQGFLKEKSL